MTNTKNLITNGNFQAVFGTQPKWEKKTKTEKNEFDKEWKWLTVIVVYTQLSESPAQIKGEKKQNNWKRKGAHSPPWTHVNIPIISQIFTKNPLVNTDRNNWLVHWLRLGFTNVIWIVFFFLILSSSFMFHICGFVVYTSCTHVQDAYICCRFFHSVFLCSLAHSNTMNKLIYWKKGKKHMCNVPWDSVPLLWEAQSVSWSPAFLKIRFFVHINWEIKVCFFCSLKYIYIFSVSPQDERFLCRSN